MIIDKLVTIIGNSRNLKHYRNKGYEISVGVELKVNPIDMSIGSVFKVLVACDICYTQKNIMWSEYYKYTNGLVDRYFCKVCCKDKRITTNINKYGGKSPTCSKDIVNKIIETNINKYGNPSSLHGTRQSITDSIFIEKYGNKSSLSNEIVKEKIKETNLVKYGVEYPLKNNDILEKLRQTNIDRYGVDNPSKSSKVIDKIESTFFEKYGMWYTQTNDMKEKSSKTCMERYNVDHYKRSSNFIEDIINNKLEVYDIKVISYNNKYFKVECEICKGNYDITSDLLYHRYKEGRTLCTICNKIGISYSSSYEDEISKMLDNLNITYTRNSNKIIYPHQIDIFIDELKLGIEFNGIYWHSEFYKKEKYHLNKYLDCREKGIYLIQIWEDDWRYKKEIVKSILLNKLGKNNNKIFARKCEIKHVDEKSRKVFLDKNHLQGDVRSSINIGLYYNDILVSLMTFGSRKINNKEQFELIRFCNVLNTTVIGGASKLFTYFINTNSFDYLISYSDNSISSGEIYRTLGFTSDESSTINYYWCDGKYKYHRFNFNKKRLVKLGFDKSLTEIEIMHNRGYYRIYGCGNKKWIYKNET